jgi:alkanesulfonate monooxygenase SsuD/methylene tetrahydromethanopterin reductase-like flavin-dependent oxidoreductase (luciferase family)
MSRPTDALFMEIHPMRVHVVNFLGPNPDYTGRTLEYLTALARQVEARGFAGLWLTDSFGRGRATLDPIVGMSVVAAVTSRIEIGTCVLQVPVRHPVELAHRIQSVHALTGSRLQLGVGSGSTQADFDLVGLDYAQRFKMLMSELDTMGKAWRGEPLPGGALTPWPGTEGGPSVMLGAWRNKRWIVYAAERCAGWIASGLYSQPEELAYGMKIYRDAGGRRAILSNVIVALDSKSEAAQRASTATVTLTGGVAEARDRLRRIKEVGFDDVLCMTALDALDDLERVRDAAL